MKKTADFIVITDAHYYSKNLGTDSESYRAFNAKAQKTVAKSSDIIKASFEKIKSDPCKNVVFCGDSTCDGEYESHSEFIALLKDLQDNGKNVFAITSTHDYQDDKITYKYTGAVREPIPAPAREELLPMYAPFGYNSAFSTYEMSYACKVDEFMVLALNSDKNGNGRSGYSEKHLNWIKEMILTAKKEGREIIAFTHHPLVSPSPLYKLIGKNDMMGEHETIREILADSGLSLIFTGHSHIHDISYIFSKNGNVFYDVSTSALAGYPGFLRKIYFEKNSYKIETEKAFDAEKYSFDSDLENQFFGMIKTTLQAAKTDVPLLAECLSAMSIPKKFTYRFGWLIKPLAKILDKITFKTVWKWTKKENGLSKENIEKIKDKKAVDFILELVMLLYSGNAPYSPDTAEYKIAMSLFSIIDSFLKAIGLPFSKIIKGFDSIDQLFEPLLFNSGIDDYNAELPKDATQADVEKICAGKSTEKITSKKGRGIATILIILVVIFIPLLPILALLLGAGFLINRIKYSKELSENK